MMHCVYHLHVEVKCPNYNATLVCVFVHTLLHIICVELTSRARITVLIYVSSHHIALVQFCFRLCKGNQILDNQKMSCVNPLVKISLLNMMLAYRTCETQKYSISH